MKNNNKIMTDNIIIENDYRMTDKGVEAVSLQVNDNELIKQVKRLADELTLSNQLKFFNLELELDSNDGKTYGEVLCKTNTLKQFFKESLNNPKFNLNKNEENVK